MITLLRGGDVFSPEPRGVRDVLMAGEKILAVAEPGSVSITGIAVEEVDVSGLLVLPGMVDSHVHLIGGGGEGGPATRAPEIRVEEIVGCGVTTVIGCLGTDGVTRHSSSLMAKAQGLTAEGVTAYLYVGSYELRSRISPAACAPISRSCPRSSEPVRSPSQTTARPSPPSRNSPGSRLSAGLGACSAASPASSTSTWATG